MWYEFVCSIPAKAGHGSMDASVTDLHGRIGSADRHFPENPQEVWDSQWKQNVLPQTRWKVKKAPKGDL